jgi:hypothetical protein
MIPVVSTSLVILGCGERKKLTSRLLPAIDRYDGPVFRVLRKHMREEPQNSADTCIVSARFGLIRGTLPIPVSQQSVARWILTREISMNYRHRRAQGTK